MISNSCSSTQTSNNPFSDNGTRRLLQAADVLNAVSSSFFITNETLQIIYFNKAFIKGLGVNAPKEVVGMQPGDVLNCLNAYTSSNGCGSTAKCQLCNFRKCINEALEKECTIEKEILLTHSNNKVGAYYIKATPFSLENSRFVSISSIEALPCSQKKLMESVFFHDLINLSGSLSGYLDVVRNFEPDEVMTHLPQIKGIADQMLDEIVSQRQIIRAEENRLDADINELTINTVIQDIKSQISFHPCFREKELVIEFNEPDSYLFTDNRLLGRVLINMLKNAAEATSKGEKITLSVKKENDEVIFAVHNKEYIQPEVQENIFNYGFSTKGDGRGIGTYGMRLLGENLLCGKVSFISYPVVGTTFYLIIPAMHPNTPYSE